MTAGAKLDVVGVVLAGGESRRFGSDKASALLAGRPLLAWVVEALSEVSDRVLVVAAANQRLPADVPGSFEVVRDQFDRAGPLAGVVTAFEQLQGRTVLLASCDAPLLRPTLLRALCDRLGDADAGCAELAGQLQPFPGVLRVDPCLPVLARRLARGERGLVSALESLPGLKRIDAEDLRPLDHDLRSFLGANTPEELAMLEILLPLD